MEARCDEWKKHKIGLREVDLEELGRERDLLESKFESNLKLIFLALSIESVDVEVVKAIPKERLQQRAEEWIIEQTADVLVPQIAEEIVEVMKHVIRQRAQQRIDEQLVDELWRIPSISRRRAIRNVFLRELWSGWW